MLNDHSNPYIESTIVLSDIGHRLGSATSYMWLARYSHLNSSTRLLCTCTYMYMHMQLTHTHILCDAICCGDGVWSYMYVRVHLYVVS